MLHSVANTKLLGKFKNETEGQPVENFCGLHSKLYIYKINNKNEAKKAKGICKPTKDKDLRLTLYDQEMSKKKNTRWFRWT